MLHSFPWADSVYCQLLPSHAAASLTRNVIIYVHFIFNQCLCVRSRANCDANFCPYCTATNTEQRKFGIQASDSDTKKCNAEKSQREERNIEKKETKNQKKEDTGNAKRFQNTVFFQ